MSPFLPAVLLLFAPQAGSASPPPTFESLSRQAAAAREAHRSAEAMALYERALKLKPSWDEGLWDYATLAYDSDQFEKCAPAFERLSRLKPGLTAAWTMAGLCQYRLHRFNAALDSLRKVEQLRYAEPAELAREARLHYALVLTKTGNFEKAVTVLTELTRADQVTPETVVAAGIAGLRRPWLPSDVPEADRDKVIKLGEAMGQAMRMAYKEAIEKFELVAKDYPDDPNVHFRFGAYLMFQEPDRGIREIQKAIELDPAHVPALVSLTMIYLKREEPAKALEYGRRAVATSPADFATHVVLGRALLAAGENVPAASELEFAVRIAPDSPEAHFNLGSAYSRLGRKEDAAREQEEFRHLRKLIDSSQP